MTSRLETVLSCWKRIQALKILLYRLDFSSPVFPGLKRAMAVREVRALFTHLSTRKRKINVKGIKGKHFRGRGFMSPLGRRQDGGLQRGF